MRTKSERTKQEHMARLGPAHGPREHPSLQRRPGPRDRRVEPGVLARPHRRDGAAGLGPRRARGRDAHRHRRRRFPSALARPAARLPARDHGARRRRRGPRLRRLSPLPSGRLRARAVALAPARRLCARAGTARPPRLDAPPAARAGTAARRASLGDGGNAPCSRPRRRAGRDRRRRHGGQPPPAIGRRDARRDRHPSARGAARGGHARGQRGGDALARGKRAQRRDARAGRRATAQR